MARALGAVLFSVVIGLIMAFLFRREEKEKAQAVFGQSFAQEERRRPAQNLLYFLILVLILVFAAWGKPDEPVGFWNMIFGVKWHLVIILLGLLAFILFRWFEKDELSAWVESTWGFGLQILPLLFGGVLAAGLLMGRPGGDAGLIPARYIEILVGGNSCRPTFLLP